MTATTAASHDAPTAAPAPEAQPDAPRPDFDAVVVGAGFAGMHQLHTLRGQGLRVHAFEAGGDVGGTWYWNRYPGARVDIESEHYSYSFDPALEQEWDWSERYSAQPELLAYASHVADRFDLRSDITFDTRVSTLDWCEDDGLWTVSTDTGTEITARFVVLATGCLSVPKQPEFLGTEDFTGEILYSANWPDDADLADLTLFSEAASWYRGANIPGKPRRFLPFPGGSDTYIAYCDAIALCGYHGFRFSPPVAGR